MLRLIILLAFVGGALSVFHEDHDHGSRFHDPKVVQSQDHIKQHMGTDEDLTKLTTEELEFRLFNLHDFDNNTKLDGLEIFSAIAHALPWEPEPEELKAKTREQIDEEHTLYYSEIIDEILSTDDLDRDGYLTYAEYSKIRREEQKHRQQ